MNELYEEGLIDPAAFTQDYAQLNAVGNNAGIEILGSAAGGHGGLFIDINNEERYRKYAMMLPLEGPGGYRSIPYAKSVSVSGATFVITDACKHPEVAIQIADLSAQRNGHPRSAWCPGYRMGYADEGTLVWTASLLPSTRYYLMISRRLKTQWWTYRGMEPNWKVLIQTDSDIMDPANFESRPLCRHNETIAFCS